MYFLGKLISQPIGTKYDKMQPIVLCVKQQLTITIP